MKVKHFLSGATLLSAALLLNAPLSAAVESDVVGYTTITTNVGFNMVGIVFNGLEGQTATLNEILLGDFQDGDVVQVYSDNGEYTPYSYWKDFGGWLDGEYNPASIKLPLGTALWLQTPNRSTEVTLKGAVLSGEYKYQCKTGLQMISFGVPKALNLNTDITWQGLKDGDVLQVHQPNGDYLPFSYWKDFGGWLDGEYNLATITIPVGSSVWLQTTSTNASFTVKGSSK